MSTKKTIDDLKDILNECESPDVKFSLVAHNSAGKAIFERELGDTQMWFYIYPALIRAKLNEWQQDLSFIDEDHLAAEILNRGT